MAENTSIPWCRHTFNAWLGCDDRDAAGVLRPGCVNCYARNGAAKRGWDVWGAGVPRRRTSAAYWKQPRKWNDEAQAAGVRERVFLGSYMDFADGDEANLQLLDRARADVCEVIEATPALDWLILSKRFDRIFSCLPAHWQRDGLPANVWLVLSAVTQAEVDAAARALLSIPVYVAVRGLSLEPLVERVRVSHWVNSIPSFHAAVARSIVGAGVTAAEAHAAIDRLRVARGDVPEHAALDWLIIGGESQSSRGFSPKWIDGVQADLTGSDCALFVKQYGTSEARRLGLVRDDYKLEKLEHLQPHHRVRLYPTPRHKEAA